MKDAGMSVAIVKIGGYPHLAPTQRCEVGI